MGSQIIWNTQTVQETIRKIRQGAIVDLGCFHERNPELKAANILFQLTHDEEQEFIKCSSDIEYFVETYCKFLTDKGRITVLLREFQRDILNTLGEEAWLESLEDVGPKVRNFILMASRQTGKCFFVDTQLVIKNTLTNKISKITIAELYDLINKHHKKNQKIIYIIKQKLYKAYEYINKKC